MTRIILAGCGHAHLAVVAKAAAFRARGLELVLIDPGQFWYSGRGSGVLGGRFSESEATVDVRRLAEACGVAFVADTVIGLDRQAGTVLLQAGEPLRYDLVSFNIGSHVAVPEAFQSVGARPVKPIASLPALREEIAATTKRQRIIVVGGGATGCEIAGNLLHLAKARNLLLSMTLVTAAGELLPDAPQRLRHAALRSLGGRGGVIHLGDPVTSAEPGMLRLASGAKLVFDRLILATGLMSHPLMGAFDLPVGPGGLRVGRTLQSTGDQRVFAAGDCADIAGRDLPKLGVYGVRAGAVLAHNLLAAAEGRALADYVPQRRALSIVDLADGSGLAMRGRFGFEGKAALAWKHWLDERFLHRYRRLYETP